MLTSLLVPVIADAQAILSGWEPVDGPSERATQRALDYLHAHPDAHLRQSQAGAHLTVSTVVVDMAGRTLMTFHAKLGMWMQLGGHLEPHDHTLAGAALRETTEESGLLNLELDPNPLYVSVFDRVPCPHGAHSMHLDVAYLVRATGLLTPVCSVESIDVAWWPLDQIPEPHDEAGATMCALASARTGR